MSFGGRVSIRRENGAIFVVKLGENDNKNHTFEERNIQRKGGTRLISMRSACRNKEKKYRKIILLTTSMTTVIVLWYIRCAY